MGGGLPDISELTKRAQSREGKGMHEVLAQQAPHGLMNPRRIKEFRECLASDDNQNPRPIAFGLDTTGSMGHVPHKMATEDLVRLLTVLTTMGVLKNQTPQVCFCGVADTRDHAPLQVGQFEADNRMDEWLTRLYIGGGGGSEYMHEQYLSMLYFLARKTKCDIWKQGGKGYAFIAGDEKCPSVFKRDDIERIFGDEVERDLTRDELLAEVRQRWHLFFFYVATGAYGDKEAEEIWKSVKQIFGTGAFRLDAKATGVPELTGAVIGLTEGLFQRADVPKDLRELGCDEKVVEAVAASLEVPMEKSNKGDIGNNSRSPRRRPTRL